jgi:hypothetical protein
MPIEGLGLKAVMAEISGEHYFEEIVDQESNDDLYATVAKDIIFFIPIGILSSFPSAIGFSARKYMFMNRSSVFY